MESGPNKTLINYTREAFALPANLAFLLVPVGAFAGLMASKFLGLHTQLDAFWEVILFASGGLEMLYLSAMPHSARFRRAVDSRRYGSYNRIRQQMKNLGYLSQLDKVSLTKYSELHRNKLRVAENLRQQGATGQAFLESYMSKMNQMEGFYVDLLFRISQSEKFLEQEVNSNFLNERNKIQSEMQGATPKLQEVYKKRLSLVDKRKEKNDQAREQLQIARVQLATLEDTIRYLVEQSMTIHDFDEVGKIIDAVLVETEEQHASILEIQSIASDGSLHSLPDIDVSNESATNTGNSVLN